MALLTPDDYHASLASIDVEGLVARGARAFLVDLDNTLLQRKTTRIPATAFAFADRVRSAGAKGCIVSNNWHGHVADIASELGFLIVPKALKPLPFSFRAAARLCGVDPAEAIVVGDQLFTDVLGGNALGMRTVLVTPLSASDLPHTLLLRKIEARLLAGRTPIS